MSNWWDGKALDQNVHEQINVMHYPGTRQLCVQCDEPTGRCEEDSMYRDNTGPLCEACYKKTEVASTDEGRELKIRNAEAAELRRELEETKRELATERSLMESLERLDRATSPCGHNQQYLWSPDGVGKRILCVLCAYKKADEERDTLKRELDEVKRQRDELQDSVSNLQDHLNHLLTSE